MLLKYSISDIPNFLKSVAVLEQLTGEILGRYAINLKKPPAR